jgi:superfamily I DNA/RNA helicase
VRDPDAHARGLNPEQAAAVLLDHEAHGPALVLAGAGSGKTTVLARRIARQAELDGDGGGILALTFTKDAAEEMEARVRGLLGRDDGDRAGGRAFRMPGFGTFHAFAYGLLRDSPGGVPNWRRLGFAASPAVADPGARTAWLRKEREARGLALPVEMLEGCLAHPFEGDAVTIPPAGLDAAVAADLRRRYREHLLASAGIAFDDMVSLAIRLLREHPEALDETRRSTRRVLVDEFQDTSPDQLELLRLILGGSPSLFLVGDDDQAIYAFRGADPGNIARARELFPGLRILKLETNYRSTPPIVAYANGIFRDKPEALRKTLRAGRPLPPGGAPAPVRTLVHASGAEQGAWMAGEMRRLMREEGLGWKDMAVLYRLNALEPYYRSMLARLAGREAAEQVVLATVHASKGLQYPAVFFAGLEDGVLPYRRPGGREASSRERLAEERRIFYVGVTRAERFLYLCACRSRMARGRLRDQEPSPFLREGAGSGIPGREAWRTGLGGRFRAWFGGLGKG